VDLESTLDFDDEIDLGSDGDIDVEDNTALGADALVADALESDSIEEATLEAAEAVDNEAEESKVTE
jgi:hypothetical protein